MKPRGPWFSARSLVALGFLGWSLVASRAATAWDPESDRFYLIFQDAPIPGPGHSTPELFANEVDSVTQVVQEGELGTVSLYAALVSDAAPHPDPTPDECDGIQGWSIGAKLPGDRMMLFHSATTAGTAAAPVPEGFFSEGFRKTEANFCRGSSTSYVVSGVVLSFVGGNALPSPGTSTVMAMEVESRVEQGPEPVTETVRWAEELCSGLCPNWACGQAAPPMVTVWGNSSSFTEQRPVLITFVAPSFRRGDSNGDGKVDISDAVRIFMFLFLGAKDPGCLDAADSNDDASVDLSDGIHILLDFFREGTAIPDPGPFDCGPDPTPDELKCLSYPPCSGPRS